MAVPKTMIIYDFETTGVTPFVQEDGRWRLHHEPIQLAAIAVNTRTLTIQGEYCTFIRPIRPHLADPGALKIHGYTLDMLADKPHPKDVAAEFVAWLNQFYRAMPCGYNLDFDQKFMRMLIGKTYDWNYQSIDVLDLARAHLLLPGKTKDAKLPTVAAHLGITDHHAHDALGDVRATLSVLQHLTGRVPAHATV